MSLSAVDIAIIGIYAVSIFILAGLSVLLGGMWVMNVSYWGFNQYIIQRALGAKDIREAQKGIVLAAFLKLLMPVIIVLPGIAAAALAPNSIDRTKPTHT